MSGMKFFALALLCSTLVCLTAVTVLATDVDQSTPKAAALSFAKALEGGDDAAARKVVVGTEEEKQVVDAMIEFTSAVKKLRDVAVKKYADKADEVTGPGMTMDATKALDDTDIKIDGKTAVVAPTKPQPGQAPTHLKNIDGKWVVDLSETLKGSGAPGQNIEQMHAMVKAWSAIFNETAGEIEQDKYPTPNEANQALETKLMASLKSLGPTSAPATAP